MSAMTQNKAGEDHRGDAAVLGIYSHPRLAPLVYLDVSHRLSAYGSGGADDAQRNRRSHRCLHVMGVVDAVRRGHQARG